MILGGTPFGTAPLASGEGEWVREPFGVISISSIAFQDAAEFLVPAGTVVLSGYVGTPYCAAFAPEPGEIALTGYVGDPLNTRFDPPLLWPSYASDGTSIIIPIADLIGLTAAEADATTGDWREILQAILLTAVEYHRSFTWSDQPRTYNAFGMNLLHTQTFDRHFGITFYTDMGEPNVAPEP
jgi:hypothetical protein